MFVLCLSVVLGFLVSLVIAGVVGGIVRSMGREAADRVHGFAGSGCNLADRVCDATRGCNRNVW
jgi:hypothetical protein